jgi:hypothetical protein
MATAATMDFDLYAEDVTKQKKVKVSNVKPGTTVRELVKGLVGRMRLVENDKRGNPLEYRARLEREGRHLHDSELVSDALRPDDELVLHTKINAG